MWLRFRKAGLPPDHAVALMERQQLLVVGLRLMVLPAALTGALAWVVMHRRGRAPVQLPAGLRTALKLALAALAVTLALLLPFSFASATWALAALLVVGYLRYERRPAGGRTQLPLRRRAERQASPLVATILVVLVAAVVSLGRQLDQPVQLLGASVTVKDPAGTIDGVYISSDADEIFIGRDDEIKAIPRSTVREVTLGPPRERAPSPSIASRVLGGNRFAITPFEWWCNGERYGWGEMGDLCRTQIELVKRDGEERAQRRDLAGDAIPVTLRCPVAAERACRGFLRMASRERYQFGPGGLPRPVVFADRVRPFNAPDTREVGVAPGQTVVMCVPVDGGQRGLLRNALPVGDTTPLDAGTGKRSIVFDLTVSADREGRNVVRSEPYVVNVTRPGQPIEYWGDCATLRVRCTGTAGTKRTADVGCTVSATRPSSGRATVTIVDGAGVRHARGAGELAGRVLRVHPTPLGALEAGRYQAVVLLERGGSARKFWTFFSVRKDSA